MIIKGKKFYLSGINGIGMSAIAQMLQKMGAVVLGSDISRKPITNILENNNVVVHLTQEAKNITEDIDYFIYSTAIKKNNEEFIQANKLAIPTYKRGEVLAFLFNTFLKSIAVAGTHGKTTTSSMFAVCLKEEDPYFAIGGIVPEYQNNMRIGTSSYFVAEADESDNSFLYMQPQYSVITNIEMDHLENHSSFDNILESFKKFIDNTKTMVLISKDCKNIIKHIDLENDKIKTYSILKEADIYATDILNKGNITEYKVHYKDKVYDFRLQIPGKHNVSNSLPVIYILLENGIDYEIIKKYLFEFLGANRRFQILYDKEYLVIDDYGHHPTEIKSTIQSVRDRYKNRNLILIFEPHRYSRTHFFKDEFIESLKLPNKTYLLPIYSASEEDIYNISSYVLVHSLNKQGYKAELIDYEGVKLIKDALKKDDIVLFMGAGSITNLAHQFVKKGE